MGFYDEMQVVATEVLTEFDQGGIVLLSVGAATGDGWNPTAAAETPVPLRATASGVSSRYVTKGLAVASDKQIVCAVPSVMPKQDDFVTISGTRFKIVAIETKPEAGTPVAIVLICRRGG